MNNSEFDFYCVKMKRKSKQVYRAVGWSGDKLACCEACNESPWSGKSFTDLHKPIKTIIEVVQKQK